MFSSNIPIKIVILLMLGSIVGGMFLERKLENSAQIEKENIQLKKELSYLNNVLMIERNGAKIAVDNTVQLEVQLTNLSNEYTNVTQELENVKTKLDSTNRINTLFMRTISNGTRANKKVSAVTKTSNSVSESSTFAAVQPSIAAKYIVDNFSHCNAVIIKYNNLIDFYNKYEEYYNNNNL